jgi:hypothetical protein
MRRVVEGEHLFQTSLEASIIECAKGDLVLWCGSPNAPGTNRGSEANYLVVKLSLTRKW